MKRKKEITKRINTLNELIKYSKTIGDMRVIEKTKEKIKELKWVLENK